MKIIITESQYRQYKSLLEQSVYDDEDDDGDNDDNFVTNQPFDKEGMVVEGEISGLPIKFTYSEENVNENNETEYFGEIQFYGDEFLGIIITDKRGYLIDVDFYSTLSDDDVRLQKVLKDMNPKIYYEFEHWLDSEVIPQIQD
jgi:hypothetical protein